MQRIDQEPVRFGNLVHVTVWRSLGGKGTGGGENGADKGQEARANGAEAGGTKRTVGWGLGKGRGELEIKPEDQREEVPEGTYQRIWSPARPLCRASHITFYLPGNPAPAHFTDENVEALRHIAPARACLFSTHV